MITGTATALAYDADGRVSRRSQALTAIPYYAWANRGPGEMAVWLARDDSVAKPAAWPTIATRSRVTTSGRRSPRAVHDAEEPASSSDPTSYFDWWPRRGTSEWIEYAFERPEPVSRVEVYWFDDTGRGEVRVPASWRVLYRRGDGWVPVEAKGPYGVERDEYNVVDFQPVTTSGLRLQVTSRDGFSSGLQEWRVR